MIFLRTYADGASLIKLNNMESGDSLISDKAAILSRLPRDHNQGAQRGVQSDHEDEKGETSKKINTELEFESQLTCIPQACGNGCG